MKLECPQSRLLRRALRLFWNVLALIGIFAVLRATCIDVMQVKSGSMSPTLRDGARCDWVLCEKWSYWFRSPRRWDVFSFESDDGVEVVKRIAGLPGETMQLAGGLVVINGQPVAFPSHLQYLHYYSYGPTFSRGRALECKNGYAYLGDDSKDSQDCRYDGPLRAERIKSRILLRIWPPSRFGWVR